MNLVNGTRYAAGLTVGMDPDGRERVVVAAKGTFLFPASPDEAPRRAPEQVPLVDADVFTGEPGLSAPLYESDFAPVKAACDVLLQGSAYAPGGRPAAEVPVLLEAGPVKKGLLAVGPRAWMTGFLGVSVTDTVPFVRQPVSYDVAFGGRDVSDPDPKRHRWYPSNHAGRGFHVNTAAEAIHLKPLPSTEEIGAPVRKPSGKYRPMAFGPIGRAWEPRARLAGTYDARWKDEVFPFLPKDFDEEYYQSAPPDQRMPFPKGGERVTLVNLTPEGRVSFVLPPTALTIAFFPAGGAPEEVAAVVDTLFLEPDARRFTLTWRASRPVKRNLFEIAEVRVGALPRGWHRARAAGKTYAPSLADAIAHPRGVRRRRPEAAR